MRDAPAAPGHGRAKHPIRVPLEVTSRIWALRGGRKLLLLAKGDSGQLSHPGSVVGLQARPKLTHSGRRYLSRTRRAAIRFSLRFSDSAGATYTYTRDATLTR